MQGIAQRASSSLLFVTDKSLYRLPLPSGEVGKICDAPTEVTFQDVACNRAQHGILLLCHGTSKNYRDWWPAYYLREQERKPTSLVLRRVNALVGAVFDRDGHLFFASGGDIWEGDISKPTEPEEPPAVEANRFAPVAILETANTTPNSTGARKLAVAGRIVYAQMTRMGGSGWGEIMSAHTGLANRSSMMLMANLRLTEASNTTSSSSNPRSPAFTSMDRISAPAIFAKFIRWEEGFLRYSRY